MTTAELERAAQNPVVLGALIVGAMIALFIALKVTKFIVKLLFVFLFLAAAAGAAWYYFGRH